MRSAFAALLLLALVPFASAQNAADPFVIVSASQAPPIPYAGSTNVTITVGAGCATALQAAAASGSANPTATITADGPEWLTAAPLTITLPVANCVNSGNPQGSGYVAQSGILRLTAAAEAPGVVFHNVNVTATLPGPNNTPSTDMESFQVNVTFRPNHTITPSISFPTTLTGTHLNFTVSITYGGNAPGMVMIEGTGATSGAFAGLASSYYSPGQTKVFPVTYTAPTTVWNETTISFHAFSHYLINATNQAGPAELAADFAWVVRNSDPEGSPASQESPLGPAALGAILFAAVLLARRRR